jgi:hypothetical protein
MERKRVVILNTQEGDWEGLFVDGSLINEGHHLGEGDTLFLLKQAEKLDFKSSDIVISTLTNDDSEYVESYGNFPQNLSELKGDYNHG